MPEGLRFGESGTGAADVDRQILGVHTDELYERVFLAPGGGFGVNTIDVQVLGHGAETSFPNAVTSTYAWALKVKDNWRNHYARVTVYFTDLVGGGANFSIRVAAWGKGSSAGIVGTLIGDVTTASAGPGTAGAWAQQVFSLATTPITSARDSVLTVFVERDGAGDPNNNSMVVMGALLEVYRA